MNAGLYWNWVDYLLVIIIGVNLYLGWQRGFIRGALDLLTWSGSIFLAFACYQPFAPLLSRLTALPITWTRPLAFTIILFLTIIVLAGLTRRLEIAVPLSFSRRPLNRYLGILPGAVDALVIAAIFIVFLMTLPFPPQVSAAARDSNIGEYLAVKTEGMVGTLDRLFGEIVSRTLTVMSLPPESAKSLRLAFKVADPLNRPDLENMVLELINIERANRHLDSLEPDPALSEVARLYSTDMFTRGYFSHISPEGLTPFDRIRQANIGFLIAGENLALAPTVATAHNGLMNSPGHRANILRSQFGKVGIGVMDGGSYGLIVTEIFRN